jgi:hypothetical protein
MKYFRIIFSGPLSALSIVILSAPFWRLRVEDEALLLAIGWTIAWAIFEIIWLIRKQSPSPRLLTHLRWGPAAVLLIFIGVVVSYDKIQIYQSKQTIRNYVYSGSYSDSEFEELSLYNNYRGWCGNGAFAVYHENYIDTALEGFKSDSPAVRLRALKASHKVSSLEFDERYTRLIHEALLDSDPEVASLAFQYKQEHFGFTSSLGSGLIDQEGRQL